MKNIIIIVSIVLVVGLLIWWLSVLYKKRLIFPNRSDNPPVIRNQVGNAGTIGKPCSNMQLAAPPPDKEWSCINGDWIMVNKKVFSPQVYFYRSPQGGCFNNGFPQPESSCIEAGIAPINARIIRLTNV